MPGETTLKPYYAVMKVIPIFKGGSKVSWGVGGGLPRQVKVNFMFPHHIEFSKQFPMPTTVEVNFTFQEGGQSQLQVSPHPHPPR